jgi:CRISPR-associated protein Cmr6
MNQPNHSGGGRPLPPPARALARNMPDGAHAGLWHEKFFDAYQKQKNKQGKEQSWYCDNKLAGVWLARWLGLKKPMGVAAQLSAHQNRLAGLRAHIPGSDHRDFKTTWHFATGLGNPHPSENGFVWHPTLGVPYLPSSGVKGLLNAWLAWQGVGKKDNVTCARRWLGTPTRAGALIFFDALPVAPVTIGTDVMTPHMGDWYEKGGNADPNNAKDWQAIPADWHNPKPITFLVVKQGVFRFMIAPTPRAHDTDVKEALDQLEGALALLGAGAKTAAGYGRMNPL